MINIRRIMCLQERGERKKILSPHEESNPRPSYFLLRCFSAETQRLDGELGLLCDLITTHHQAHSFFFLVFIFLTFVIVVIGPRKYFYIVTVFLQC